MKRPNIFQRTALRLLGFGYGDAGASHKRRAFKKYTSKSKSPLSDIDKNNDTLRSRARSLYMGGSSLATSAIKSLRTSVVGPGLYLYAQVDKKYLGLTDQEAVALNSEIEAEFELWAADKKSASTTGLHDFYELQQLALMSCRLSGDVFVLFEYDPTTWMRPYGLRVRLLEADRITCHYR